MKYIFSMIFLMLIFKTYSQKINYCDYFTLEVSEIEYQGKKIKAYSPIIIENTNGSFYEFVKTHQIRFDYILFKNSAQYKTIADNFPDTNKIHIDFCNEVVKTNEVETYLRFLTPKKLTIWGENKVTFSVDELMKVASKFFYCDAINKKDTTIQSHICVGINGTKDFKTEKDLTLLEAFSIEGIFKHINNKKRPLFYSEFYDFKNKMNNEQLHNFKDFDTYLLEIRKLCYDKMQNNEDLKRKLLSYYRKNRNNLNFEIK